MTQGGLFERSVRSTGGPLGHRPCVDCLKQNGLHEHLACRKSPVLTFIPLFLSSLVPRCVRCREPPTRKPSPFLLFSFHISLLLSPASAETGVVAHLRICHPNKVTQSATNNQQQILISHRSTSPPTHVRRSTPPVPTTLLWMLGRLAASLPTTYLMSWHMCE
jgi:hypothetical protein